MTEPLSLSEWLAKHVGVNRADLEGENGRHKDHTWAALGRAFFNGEVRPDPVYHACACAWCGARIILGAVAVGYVKNTDGTSSLLCDTCYGKKDDVARAKDIALTPKTVRSEKGVLMTARTSGGSPLEYWFPSIFIEDVDKARDIVTKEHDKLGHAAPGEWFKSCVPQTEASSILDHSEETPDEIRRVLVKGGLDRNFLLYALTLKRTRSKKHPGKGVWLGTSTKGQ